MICYLNNNGISSFNKRTMLDIKKSEKTVNFNGHFYDQKEPSKLSLKSKLIMAVCIPGIPLFIHGCDAVKKKLYPPNHYSYQETQIQADKVQHQVEFVKASLIYDISDILDNQKLESKIIDRSKNLVKSKKTYGSDEAGIAMNTLVLAAESDANKDQVIAKSLRPYLNRGLKKDSGIFSMDSYIGSAPKYYIAAALYSKFFPELINYSKKQEDKGFIKNFFSKAPELSIGDRLDTWDREATEILRENINTAFSLPYDDSRFGPVSIAYAIRGNLNPEKYGYDKDFIKNMSTAQREKYRKDITNPDIATIIVTLNNLDKAINNSPKKINSGYAALALDLSGYFTKDVGNKLIEQIDHRVKSESSALKAYTLARQEMYQEIPAKTRAEIRKFQIKHPDSQAAAIYTMAEQTYQNKLTEMLNYHKNIQDLYDFEITKRNPDPKSIRESSIKLQQYAAKLIYYTDKEVQVEEIADPKGSRLKSLNKFKLELYDQIGKTEINIDNAKKFYQNEAYSVKSTYNDTVMGIGKFINGTGKFINGTGKLINFIESASNMPSFPFKKP